VATPEFIKGAALLKYEDGKPAILSLGDSRVAWWNIDLAHSDWASKSAFLPFFGEYLRHLAAGASAPQSREFSPGEPLRFDAASLDPASVRLVDEREQAFPAVAEDPRKPSLLASAEILPGSYRWMVQDGVLDRAVVNFPDAESDLRQMTAAELEQQGGLLVAGIARERLGDLREGRPLWPWFLAAAALLFLLEGILLCLFKAKADAPKGEVSVA
jgi:hypothetical protein